MRSAAARAAIRRGSSTRILPVAHGSPFSTSGTRVVLPAPGGATSTATFDARSAAVSAGRASSMGRAASKAMTAVVSEAVMVNNLLTPAPARSLLTVSRMQRLGRRMARMGTDMGQAGAAARRLGRLRQGLLHRHGGDDAFDARRRGRRRPGKLDARAGRVRQAVPHARLLPHLRPVPGARDRPRLAHLPRPQGRALRLFLRAVGDDPVRLQGAGADVHARRCSASRSFTPKPSSSRSARSGSSICCRSSSSSPS